MRLSSDDLAPECQRDHSQAHVLVYPGELPESPLERAYRELYAIARRGAGACASGGSEPRGPLPPDDRPAQAYPSLDATMAWKDHAPRPNIAAITATDATLASHARL